MTTVKESNLQGKDALANTGTMAVISAGDMFEGSIGWTSDADWIKIELSEGKKYTFTVGGSQETGELNDSILELMDSKGSSTGIMNDDVKPGEGKLGSELTFAPQAGSGTQTYYVKVSGYTGNPGANNTGTYTLKVSAVDVLPPGESADIEGTKDADKLTGTGDAESIAGLGGDDTLYGGGGDDSLSGGDGNDLLKGGAGGDTLRGGKGEDTISYAGSPMGVTINLNDGTATGGDASGDDLGTMIENVIGSDYDDALTGTDAVNVGNKLWGEGGDDVLSGREGEDELYGGAGDDSLSGGDEADTLEGGPGADTLTGGLGKDTASYRDSMMGVTVRLHSQQAMGGDAEGDIWGDTVTVEYEVPAEDPEDPAVTVEETVPDIINLSGSIMADILAGDSRDNTIRGNGGDDKLYGGPGGGNDELHGGTGNDMLYGGKGNDKVMGDKGDDTLFGGAGADEIMGGAGSDMIHADVTVGQVPGDTVLDGGEDEDGMDRDTLSFEKLVDTPVGATGAAFTLGNRGANNAIPDGVHAVGFEHVIGTDEDDVITGGANIMEEIEGRDGGDTLVGGDGGGDTVSYENSDRRVRVDLGDSNTSGGTAETPSGGHATGDTISGFENVKGSAFGDVLEAIDGAADAVGSTLWGLGGDDSLTGRAGNDTLEGGAGADELDGGTTQASTGAESGQSNTLSYAGSDAGVTVNLATVSASGGHAEGDEIETYEYEDQKGTTATTDDEDIDVATFVNVTGSMHNDRLTGDMFGNELSGGAGNDTLRGGIGADTLAGGPGEDRLDGGSSTNDNGSFDNKADDAPHEDWATYRGAMKEGVTVNLNTGSGTDGEAMGDTLSNIELIWGSKYDDMFVASEGADIIHGDGGSDTVSYEASKHGVTVNLAGTNPVNAVDTTWTAAVADDPSTTTIDESMPQKFNSPADTVVANWRDGGTAVSPGSATRPTAVEPADTDATTKSYAEGDVLRSIENVTGSRSDDVIVGDTVPNVIKGGGGPDRISGGGQDDKLHGDAGDDVIGARPAEDLDGNGTVGEATVRGEVAATDAGDDEMYGGAGNDTIYGGAGSDKLYGGAGDDDLIGDNSGQINVDTFVFEPGNGSDVIISFQPGTAGTATQDRTDGDFIDLSAFGIKAGDLAGLLSERAGNVIVNLEDYGGGRITIQDEVIADLEAVGLAHVDTNGATAGVGTEDGASSGIFII